MTKDVDNPELTDADFARAKPFKELFPEQHKSWKRTGRPPVEAPKVHIGFRLAADVVNGIRATGPGLQCPRPEGAARSFGQGPTVAVVLRVTLALNPSYALV